MVDVWANKEKWQQGFNSNPHVLHARALITIGAAGAVSSIAGPAGVGCSRTSAGLYALTFFAAPAIYIEYGIEKSATLAAIKGTAKDASAGTASFTTLAGGAALTIDDDSAGTPDTVDWSIGPFPDPADTPASADALRDDLVANLIPAIRNAFATLADRIEDGGTALAVTDPASGDVLTVDFWVRLNTDAG